MPPRTSKRQDEADNAQAVEEFLARGGQITKVEPGPLEFSPHPKRARRRFVRTMTPEQSLAAIPPTTGS
ncbi:hypothetical protein [Zavarzinia sp. CC-PAN008]|uniref:hypothetical protein n=1 Tax=Zavarzinia sp. CC-PAN008 TaxID=3243332 RepID=UPI003F743EBE